MRTTLLVLLAVAILAAVIAGTGSLPRTLLGEIEWLTIDGHAAQVSDWPAAPLWSSYGGDAGGARRADLPSLNTESVEQLREAWRFNTGHLDIDPVANRRTSFQVTPIRVGDALAFCTPHGDVIALDPSSGEQIWRFEAGVDLTSRPANGFVCRGVSQWHSKADIACSPRLFVGTIDARVIALDAESGERCLGFGDNGEVALKPSTDLAWPGEYQISSAPAITEDNVIVGSAISDNLRTQAPHGTVHAFDAETGVLRWAFDPIPREASDPARRSWPEDDASLPGHANVWSTISVDLERNLVVLPTSSPSPDFFGGARAGDNRYANSVVALNADTGAVVWHFQTVHHDVWDYDVPAQPGLYTVTDSSGQTRDIVAQITKTGLVFVLDRDTGEPIFEVIETETPQSGVEGEVLSSTQPIPSLPLPVVPSNPDPASAFGLTFWDQGACEDKLAGLKHEGLYTPPSEQGTAVMPFNGGGGNWGSAAFDASRNLLVVPMSNLVHAISLMPNDPSDSADQQMHGGEYAPMHGVPWGMTRETVMSPLGLPCNKPPWSVLAGIDLGSGEIVWRRPHGSVREFAGGVDLTLGMPTLGGPMVTGGGLTFIGGADAYLHGVSTATGETLWRGELPAAAQATPMGYSWQGRDYVVIAAGGHKDLGLAPSDAIVAFALPED